MVDYIYQFTYVEPSLHLWDGAYLITMDDIFDGSWIQFVNILLSIFASMFLRKKNCGLGIRVIAAFKNEFHNVPFVSIL